MERQAGPSFLSPGRVLAAVGVLGWVAAGGLLAPGCRAQEPGPGLRLLEAVEMTLAHDPAIALVRSRIDSFRGALVSAAGPFDPLLGADVVRTEEEAPGAAEDEVALSSTVSLFQQLRTGLVLEPAVDLVRPGGGGAGPGHQPPGRVGLVLAPAVDLERTGDGGAGTSNQATVSFGLRQPLLRGRGRAVVTAAERSAALELDASRLDLQHAVSTRLAAVVSQYWAVAAAALDLEVLRATEESSRDLLATTRRLIAADVTPAAELVQLEADLAAREASRIAGEQTLFAALQELGREIGLDAGEIAALPLPSDPFPEVAPETVPDAQAEGLRFAREALARRADLQAARERLSASEAFLVAARNALRPRVDLLVTPSYSGEVTGDEPGDFFSPVFQDIPGLSTLVGLSLTWPVRNHQAEGALIQTEAAVDQAALEVERIETAIGADTPAALDAVRRSALQVELSALALGYFEEAVENEEKKLQAGSSTLIDLITQRDRLTAARQRWVRAQLALALALVELRFQTGTLVAGEGEPGALRFGDVTTLPTLARVDQ